nr:inactive TPR repeat-containing thioredoxin TTL3-like isoform X2 [Quercus suber]
MSHSAKPIQEISSFDSLTTRLHDSLSCDENKPDFRELDLASPVSPLRTRGSVANGALTPSSSSSSSGSASAKNSNNTQLASRSETKSNNHSGELSGLSETSPIAQDPHRSSNSKPGHRRSVSAEPPLIYSGGNGATSASPNGTVLPSGNICPSGKILKAVPPPRNATGAGRILKAGSGTGNYGHGSIVRGGGGGGGAKLGGAGTGSFVDANVTGNIHFVGEAMMVRRKLVSTDPEEVKKAGNDLYKRGHFVEALSLYDRAISLAPDNAAFRSNRAAALTALGRLGEAVKECEEAVRLEPSYGRPHQRLASLYLRFGQVEYAQRHLFFPGQQPDQSELQKLKSLVKHLNQCTDARKIGDWKSAIRESDAAMEIGADYSPQLIACKAEALLKLHQVEEAESILSNIPKLENYPPCCSQTKVFGMLAEVYLLYVRAQVEMALGRIDNAVVAAEKAGMIDGSNVEVARVLNNVKMVARARSRGNDLFSSGRFSEACLAYGEGLKYDSCNSVLYCNRAVCWSKLGLWEKSVEDCNQALKIQPNYTKALLRRAVSNAKLERWAEATRDYEVLRRELPGDNEVAESLHRAQIALKKSRGLEVHSMTFCGEVEEVSSLNKFKSATLSPGVSVIHFKVASNEQCEEISPFINMLCVRYPSVNFLRSMWGSS